VIATEVAGRWAACSAARMRFQSMITLRSGASSRTVMNTIILRRLGAGGDGGDEVGGGGMGDGGEEGGGEAGGSGLALIRSGDADGVVGDGGGDGVGTGGEVDGEIEGGGDG